jgi:hypothetical protein
MAAGQSGGQFGVNLSRTLPSPRHLRLIPSGAEEPPAAENEGNPTAQLLELEPGPVFAGRRWLGGGNLAIPIYVRIEAPDPGILTVLEPETGIFGVGANLAEAIEDFRSTLEAHRSLLEGSQPLSAGLKEQLDFLRRHLRG